ncbi:Conserved_hypothetical protein [Hexamita inflata]|uniref:CFA20 domain-containing protein n=1 Tax=Hexamita inflata TaxID=28002 RepID=A0AA86P3U1_9EUKA|nr:Conserved hypothetical protein [Hexamita inflata]CAI9930186.1 Conserved hypothetical protein [Hexamita inflata]
MYKQAFQGCPFITLLEAKGSTPMKDWDVSKANCQRLYNKDVKTYVIDVTGQSSNSAKLPSSTKSLGITQQYLAFQMFLPKDQPFSLTITVETASKEKLRFVLSTSIKQLKISVPHARIPLHMVAGAWSCLVLDLCELARLFHNQEFSSIMSIEITPFCTILRIASLNACPLPTIELFSELDQKDCMRNQKLARPKFSKRQHQPLDAKLNTFPMHVQVIDEFYTELFKETRVHDDICLRDFQQIIEARKAFMDGFNQYDQYTQNDVKITKIDVNVSQFNQEEVDQYEQTEKELREQKEALKQQTLNKLKEAPKPTTAQKPTTAKPISKQTVKQTPKTELKPLPVSSIQTTLEEMKKQQTEAEQMKKQIDQQLNTINKRNLNEDFQAQQNAKTQQNLKQLNQNAKVAQKQPPKALPDIIPDLSQEHYCAQGIDLTVSAVPVQLKVQKNGSNSQKDVNDKKQLTPVRKVGGEVRSQVQTIKDVKKKVEFAEEKEEIFLGEPIKEDAFEQDAENFEIGEMEIEMDGADENQNEYEGGDDAEYQDAEEEQQENFKENQHTVIRSQVEDTLENEPKQSELSSTAVQLNLLPDPADHIQNNQDAIPNPAGQNILNDPVAFGLEYDPETGCYYEKE